MTDSAPLRIALASEDPLARGALSRALTDSGPEVVVASGPVAELEASRPEGPLDAVLWDVGLHPSEASRPELGAPVLALVAEEASGELALAAGARGLLFRDAPPSTLRAALHATARGLCVFDAALASVRAAPRSVSTSAMASAGPEALTPREREVLALVAEGLSNKAIAERLSISEHTAKFHVNAVLSKLGVQRRTEAIVRAARLGLISL